jgi:hypothetical protein
MVIYMNKYALINNQNIVDNIILWDGGDSWQPPQTMTCINVEGLECSIGWAYDGSVFTAPVVVEVTLEPILEPTKEELLAQLQTLTQQIQSLT